MSSLNSSCEIIISLCSSKAKAHSIERHNSTRRRILSDVALNTFYDANPLGVGSGAGNVPLPGKLLRYFV